MSEALVKPLSFSDDIDRPPLKKRRISSEVEESSHVPISNPPSNIVPDKSDNVPVSNDIFDPVQAILEAGKLFQEEEIEKQNSSTLCKTRPVNKSKSSTNIAPPEPRKQKKEKDHEVVSVSDSDEETASDEEINNSKKSGAIPGKINGVERKKKKKSKSSSMRRNIKDILTHDQLDDLTIAARKEEEERRQRMNLKLQQQQQHLRFLQQQQQQLMKESFDNVTTELGKESLARDFPFRLSEDLLLKRLMRKKHITVSLDDTGTPTCKRPENVDCIDILSSDEESEQASHRHLPVPQPQFNFNSVYPSHNSGMMMMENLRKEMETAKKQDEIIAISSGEEDNGSRPSAKDARLYEETSSMRGEANKVGELDSDDDCVIISPGPDGEEEVEEKDECSQDLLNVPDHLGRVLVNVGHPEEDSDVFLPPQIARIVKPHQIGGIRFLYDNVVESKDLYSKSSGFGCILAHAMGLGKTLQTVSFCDVLLRTSGKTVLIIVPINTIQNWLNEFNRYLPAKATCVTDSDCNTKRRSTKSKSCKKNDQQVEDIPKQNGHVNSEQSSSKGNEDTTAILNQCFDSIMNMSSMDSNNCADSEAAERNTPSQSESGIGSVSSQESSSGEPDIRYRNFEVYLLNETVKSLEAREKAIRTWTTKGGVLLIGYEMYRMLALKKLKKSSRKVMMLDHEERAAEAESLDNIYECLVDPGPDCVICDEGHRIKNSGAGISQALKAIKTKRRVVLTGYPLQNNLMEYWCMVDFVRPNYLGTKAEFSNMFERPIQNGQCADSTYEDKRLMKYRSHVLHSLLEGFVQRRSHVVLRNALPHKEEWVFLVRLTPVQLKIYREFIRYLKEDLDSDNASTNPIKAFAVCCKIWNHPDVLWNVVKKNLDLETDLDIDEVKSVSVSRCKPKRPTKTGRPRGRPPLNGISLSAQSFICDQDSFQDSVACSSTETISGRAETSGISLDWAKPLFENYIPEVMENGVKFELLFLLIQETIEAGDKLLVFSQSLLTLDLMEVFLKRRLDWKKCVDYVRLDGSTAGLEREKLINEFNRSTVQKVFLISTRAGSLGINLVGANRVCIFDASWNPCHDSQAVCRVYRYGQTKPCHIYRFVADCTLEKRIYDRQVSKKGMADRIVDEMNPNAPFKSKDVSSFLVLQHDLLDKLPFIKCDLNITKFSDPVLCNLLRKIGDHITQEPFEHESLLIDQKHQRLSKSEKRLALRNYEKEKQTVANAYASYSRPSYAQYYSAIGNMSTPSSSSYSSSYSMPTMNRFSGHSSMETNGKVGSGSSNSSMGKSAPTSDSFERHIVALRSRGIAVYAVQLHQDTYLNDPSGLQDIFVKSGERVYILASQKGTYLRIQGKLLRVPFVGGSINQEKAESFVMSLLHSSGAKSNSGRHASPAYPVEQKLPPSNNMLFQKNPNHLQITNSRSNSGGDVMMGDGTNWDANDSSQQSNYHPQQTPSLAGNSSKELGLGTHFTQATAAPNPYKMYNDGFAPNMRSNSNTHRSHSSLSDLQSLSKLETFCHRTAFPFSQTQADQQLKRWQASASSTSESFPASTPPGDMEVIKLNHSHSSNSSNSSSSRTNSPYNGKMNWNNSNDGSGSGGSVAANSSWNGNKDPSFYTDFTITPISSASNNPMSSRSRSSHSSPHLFDNGWNNTDRPPVPSEEIRQRQLSLTNTLLDGGGGQFSQAMQQSFLGMGSANFPGQDQFQEEKFRSAMMAMSSHIMGIDFTKTFSSTSCGNSNKNNSGGDANMSLLSLLQDTSKYKDKAAPGSSASDLFSGIHLNRNSTPSPSSSQF